MTPPPPAEVVPGAALCDSKENAFGSATCYLPGPLGSEGDRLAVGTNEVHGIRQTPDGGNGVNTIAAVDNVRRTIRGDNDGVISVASEDVVGAISREDGVGAISSGNIVATGTAEDVVSAPLAEDVVTFATAKHIIGTATAGHEVRTLLPAHDVGSSLAEQRVTI